MSTFIERAYAKLNLALHVRGRLPDGRHALETVFAFCEDGDDLSGEEDYGLSLAIVGSFAAGVPDGEDNLIIRAARTLQRATGSPAGARLRLSKALPAASGIGGGSADAGAALRLLGSLWQTDPGIAEVIAPKIGADVPACLRSHPCRGSGVGNRLEPIELPDISGAPVLLVKPDSPLSTKDVFGRWDGIDRGPLDDWRSGRNDLEAAAVSLVPEIATVLEWLRAQSGATFARMSGSGATCFALFDSADDRDRAAALVPEPWWRLATKLR